MSFFTFLNGRSLRSFSVIILWLGFATIGLLQAQTETNLAPANQDLIESTNAAPETTPPAAPSPVIPALASVVPPASAPPLPSAKSPTESAPATHSLAMAGGLVLAALMTLGSIGGFLLYQCGLTRAKNCGHTSTLVLVGMVVGLVGYWIGGFAVQTGGVGDAHAALAEPILSAGKNTLDHELGFMAFGHYWGFMGSSGFFLMADPAANHGIAFLFLGQAALLMVTIAAALGASLERARLLAMAIVAFLIGTLIYPLLANWVWGGGCLAELGREYGLGHGFVDLAGAGVVHETAGTLALVIAMTLGPRYGKFGRDNSPRAIPGHNVPFILLGTLILLISWTAANAFADSDPYAVSAPGTGLAAVNALLAAAGGMIISFFHTAWRRQRPQPAILCRGLLGGIVAVSGCSALIDPWAAFVIGLCSGWIVQATVNYLERLRIDDPVGAFATHGAGGAWGVLATGLFANGTAGEDMNGVEGPVRGLLFGGDWHQLAAQAIGCVAGFVVVFILGQACLSLIQKILGNRVEVADEIRGLDWPQVGALGYQPDMESED